MKTIDLGNNESYCIGVSETPDGKFMALTGVQSTILKTRKGAEAWLKRRGYAPDGTRLPKDGTRLPKDG